MSVGRSVGLLATWFTPRRGGSRDVAGDAGGRCGQAGGPHEGGGRPDYGISRRWVHELFRRFDAEVRRACSRARVDLDRALSGPPTSSRTRSSCSASSWPRTASTLARTRSPFHLERRHRHSCCPRRHDLAYPGSPRLHHPAAAEAAEELVHPVRGRHAERALAGRHHPLAPGRRHPGRDLQHRSTTIRGSWSPRTPGRRSRRPTSSPASITRRIARAPGAPADRQRSGVHRGASRRTVRARARAATASASAYAHSRPYHPQTCGKVERFHQTLKRWLARQDPAATGAAGPARPLPRLLQRRSAHTGARTPHPGRGVRCASEGLAPRPATRGCPPTCGSAGTGSTSRRVTLRHDSRLHHIGLGRRFTRARVDRLVAAFELLIVLGRRADSAARARSEPRLPAAGANRDVERCRETGRRCPRHHRWEEEDSNLRRHRRRLYRPLPLATRASSRGAHRG